MSGSISINVDNKINPSERLGVKCAKFFIGPVKNSHDETATTRWNDKVREAKHCGIVAMVIGASMAIVAAGLMAGFSFLLIPTAIFMGFGVAAFLYGAVLAVIGDSGEVDTHQNNQSTQYTKNRPFSDYPTKKMRIEHPKTIREIFGDKRLSYYTGERNGDYHLFEGANRQAAVNYKKGVVYKRDKDEKYREKNINEDFRLNELYENPNFYGGVYARYKTEIIEVEDYDGKKVKINYSPMIPKSKQLTKQVPECVLEMIESLGFTMLDAKATNFVLVKKGKETHYIPIDAKFLGSRTSNSVRSKLVQKNRFLTHKFQQPPILDNNNPPLRKRVEVKY